METTYYTLYTRQTDAGAMARASGGEDRLVMFTQRPAPKKPAQRENNVISLCDYRARLEAGQDSDEAYLDAEPEEAVERRLPRARTDHGMDRMRALEALACAAMICVAAAACVMLLL